MRPFLAIALVPALLVAGCVGAPDALDAASTADATTDAALPDVATDVPFSWDGEVSPAAYVCPVVTCTGIQVFGMYADLDPKGNITALSLTMTWDAAAPTTDELRLGVSWGEEDYESVDGPSPLTLELTGIDIARSKDPYVWVWIPSKAPMALASVGTPQEFHVEGTTTQA